MNLWLVTWDTDLTQFFVCADTSEEAVSKAVLSHLAYHTDNWGTDGEENRETIADIQRESSYSAETVDFKLLCKIMDRRDKIGVYKDAYVLLGS